MSFNTTTGYELIGVRTVWNDDNHQPIQRISHGTQYQLTTTENNEVLAYHLSTQTPQVAGLIYEPIEFNWFGIYVLDDAINSGAAFSFPHYYGELHRVKTTQTDPSHAPPSPEVFINIDFGDGRTGIYTFIWFAQVLTKQNILKPISFTTNTATGRKPNYSDLLTGYPLDTRTIPNNPVIISTFTGKAKIQYYKLNKLDGLLPSLDWFSYEINLAKDESYTLPITDCVLGTLYSSDSRVLDSMVLIAPKTGKYSWSDFLPSALPSLFANWQILADALVTSQTDTVNFYQIISNSTSQTSEISRTLRRLSANNNWWENDSAVRADLNPLSSHPMFVQDDNRAYNWHIKPVAEGIGTLVMDSPRTIEIHKALQAQNYQAEDLMSTPNLHYLDWYIKNSASDKIKAIWNAIGGDTYAYKADGTQRVSNLGYLVNNIASVLGIRRDENGKLDEELEKTTNRRLQADGSEINDVQAYNPACFGSEGMLIRHLPNKFSTSGTVAGGYRKVRDIPQLLAELHEQANAAMGYQEGTAIEIQLDGQTYRYPNQLALLTELFVTAKQTATYSKGAFFSSVIGEQSIKEVMAGLGLRTVDKFMEFQVAGKAVKLYYKGISASQSIRRKLSAVSTNIGIAIGNII